MKTILLTIAVYVLMGILFILLSKRKRLSPRISYLFEMFILLWDPVLFAIIVVLIWPLLILGGWVLDKMTLKTTLKQKTQ